MSASTFKHKAMNGKLVMFALVLGLATAMPSKNLKSLRTRKNTASNGNLGIYKGKSTTIAEHNYLVSIVVADAAFCAGVIVGDSYVLTVGDCVYGATASEFTVVAGSSDGVTGTSYTVKKIIMNPNYGSTEISYDYALLRIKGTFTWGTDVGNVTLPSADPASGAALVAVGYGDTSAVDADQDNSVLNKGTMKYVTGDNCATYYSDYDVTFDETMACAYNKGKVTMCDGDFGDPFTQGNVLYGMFAAGGSEMCDASAIPVILADVYPVVDWINKYIA